MVLHNMWLEVCCFLLLLKNINHSLGDLCCYVINMSPSFDGVYVVDKAHLIYITKCYSTLCLKHFQQHSKNSFITLANAPFCNKEHFKKVSLLTPRYHSKKRAINLIYKHKHQCIPTNSEQPKTLTIDNDTS